MLKPKYYIVLSLDRSIRQHIGFLLKATDCLPIDSSVGYFRLQPWEAQSPWFAHSVSFSEIHLVERNILKVRTGIRPWITQCNKKGGASERRGKWDTGGERGSVRQENSIRHGMNTPPERFILNCHTLLSRQSTWYLVTKTRLGLPTYCSSSTLQCTSSHTENFCFRADESETHQGNFTSLHGFKGELGQCQGGDGGKEKLGSPACRQTHSLLRSLSQFVSWWNGRTQQVSLKPQSGPVDCAVSHSVDRLVILGRAE